MRRDRARQPWRHTLLVVVIAAACLGQGAATASAQTPAGMPTDVPAAASTPAPSLPEPCPTAWPFPSTFSQTSGTGRLAGGASLWTDFIYDDYGASSPQGFNASTFAQSSGLAGRQGDYVFPAGAADNNGADIFRAAVGVKGTFRLRRGTRVLVGGRRVATARRAGRVTLALGSGTSVVKLTRSHLAGRE